MGNDACIAARRRGRDKRRPRRKVGEICPVVDLRRIGDPSVRLSHLEPRGVDTAACDRALAVLLVSNRIVMIRAECTGKSDVLYNTVACVTVRIERCPREIAIAARHTRKSCRTNARCRRTICRRDRPRQTIVECCHILRCVVRCTVIDLRHIAKGEL